MSKSPLISTTPPPPDKSGWTSPIREGKKHQGFSPDRGSTAKRGGGWGGFVALANPSALRTPPPDSRGSSTLSGEEWGELNRKIF